MRNESPIEREKTMTMTTEKTVRVIWKCRFTKCKHVWAYDYQFDSLNQKFRILEDGSKRYLSSDYMGDLRCPECTCTLPKSNEVHGHYSAGHKCNKRCSSAIGDNCDCQCAGRNHGADYLV